MKKGFSEERANFTETRRELILRWQIAEGGAVEDDVNWALLLDALQERILHLLERNPDRLLSALYLLDISETRYKLAMSGPDLASNARALAQVVLERESAKIATRRRYAPTSEYEQLTEGGSEREED